MQTLLRARVFFAACGALLLAAHPADAQTQHWIRQFGTAHDNYAYAVAANGSGGVFVGGSTQDNLGGQSAGLLDAYVASYDSAGNQLWIRQLGTYNNDNCRAAAGDGAGGVYVGGTTTGSLAGPILGVEDPWLARYDSAGNQLWVRQFGSADRDHVLAAAPDGSGGVFVCGDTRGNLAGPSAGGADAWIARYDGAGNQLWIRQLGSGSWDLANAIASDGSGGLYVGGQTADNLGGTNPDSGVEDAWFARYDGAGNQLWIRQLGSITYDFATGVASDGSGGVFITGWTLGNLGGPSAGSSDAWLTHYDGAGNWLWFLQFGTSSADVANAAAADGSGGVFVGGYTQGNLGGPPQGGRDAWFARFDSGGNQIWARHLGSGGPDQTNGLAPDGSGGVYVGGEAGGNLGGSSAGGVDAWLARYGPQLQLLCEPGLGGTIACPCSNPPAGAGRGCDNSSSTGGASLTTTGAAQLSADSLEFVAQDEKPTALSVLLQGTSDASPGLVFGQGVRCAGGTLRRLYVRAAVGGTVTMPDVFLGDPSVSARSAALGDTILPGQRRWYSVYYRDPLVLGGCPAASTFNTGPTMRAIWEP